MVGRVPRGEDFKDDLGYTSPRYTCGQNPTKIGRSCYSNFNDCNYHIPIILEQTK